MKRLVLISILFFMFCTKHEQDNPFDPENDNNWPKVTAQADTVVSQTMNCLVNVIAFDANNSGSIEKYLWDRNADGWDDSTDVAAYTFSKPEGGGMCNLGSAG